MPRSKYARSLLRLGRKAFDRRIKLAPRSEDCYATHIPILIGVAAAIRPRFLVEFGSGMHSTLSFLDRAVFPSLQKIDSYENNREWHEQISKSLPADERIKLHLVDGPMHNIVANAQTSDAEIIFVDDSPSAAERVHTVNEVARHCGKNPLVILHDYELWELRIATRRFSNRMAFDAFNPQCGVMWHGNSSPRRSLDQVKTIIARFSNQIPLKDVAGWRAVFSREFDGRDQESLSSDSVGGVK